MSGYAAKNIFAVLTANDDDDDDEPVQVKGSQAPAKKRLTHSERNKLVKQAAQNSTPNAPANDVEAYDERTKEDATRFRNKREPRPTKEISAGHTLDRRSGTGQDDRPRKEQARRGNKAEIAHANPKVPEEGDETAAQEPEVPVEPPKPTLDEYYRSKGATLNLTYEAEHVQKKKEINADWIKKSNMSLIESRRDKPMDEEIVKKQKKKKTAVRESSDEDEKIDVVVGLNPGEKIDQPRREEPRRGGSNRGIKMNEEEFPSL